MGGNENVACYASSFPVSTQQLSATAMTEPEPSPKEGGAARCNLELLFQL